MWVVENALIAIPFVIAYLFFAILIGPWIGQQLPKKLEWPYSIFYWCVLISPWVIAAAQS